MSQNKINSDNANIIYAGVDVAKATLELNLGGVNYDLSNETKDHRRMMKLLAEAEKAQPGSKVHVIVEATGGYEAALVRALHEAGRLVSVIQPSRVRYFAFAKNRRAKTDPIDAAILSEFGYAIRPTPTMAPSMAQIRLTELVDRRAQLVQSHSAELNRADHYTDKFLCRQSRQLLALLERQLKACNKAIAAQIAADEAMRTRAERVQEVPGVGPVVAAVLQAAMPELGTLSDAEAAALAGLAPYNYDSGPRQGTRRIWGGRAQIRCALYMSAMSGVRHDPILKNFYLRLRTAGKKPLVALAAAMRKQIVLLNRLLKNPEFQLAAKRKPSRVLRPSMPAQTSQQLDGGAAVCVGMRT
jgi:transposase